LIVIHPAVEQISDKRTFRVIQDGLLLE